MKYWFLLLFPSVALAGGDRINQHVDQSVGLHTTVKTEVEGDQYHSDTLIEGSSTRAFALSHSLGGAAFGDCMISTQGSVVVVAWQGAKLNKWCAAQGYDLQGKPDAAAKMRCSIKDIRKLFSTQEECIEENTFTRSEPAHNDAEETNCDQECQDAQEMVLSLVGRVEALETHTDEIQRIQSRPRVVKEVNRGITDEQKQAIEQAVFGK